MLFAVVADGVVKNIVLGEPGWEPETGIAVAIEDGDADIGWTYDGETFASPEPPAPPASDGRVLMPVSFWMLRLTIEEMIAFKKLDLQQKALTVEDYDDPAKAGIVNWAVFMEHFNRLTSEIDLGHTLVQQGVGLFAQLAGLTEARVGELLAPPSA